MNHRSHENTEHDYCTGIPVKMPLVDANPLQAEVDRLTGLLNKVVDAWMQQDYPDDAWDAVMCEVVADMAYEKWFRK